MSRRPSSRTLAAALLALALPALSACLTPHAQPAPSTAVAEARKGAGAKPAACQVGALADVSPTVATFPFDDPKIDEVGTRRLTAAVAWLACNPGVPVVILPTADNHGTAQHMQELAVQRAQAVVAALRALGAKDAVIHSLAPAAADPVTGPHLVIQADGRGW
jgi:outer membrane protein OmpA-like peptidoglycan-associated protein